MRVWLSLAIAYAAFLFWYGGSGTPLSAAEVQNVAERIGREAVDPAAGARLLEFARTDDGREFFMVNLNRYRAEPRYADSRDTAGASAEEVERGYTGKMIPRLFLRACHPWLMVLPIQALAGYEGAPVFDRVTLVRYRSRRDFLDIVLTDAWGEDAEHKWAALELAHSFPAQPAITLLGPPSAVLGGLFATGVAVRAAGRRRRDQKL